MKDAGPQSAVEHHLPNRRQVMFLLLTISGVASCRRKETPTPFKMSPPGLVTLKFAKNPSAEETAILVVKAGPIPKAARIVATTPQGEVVATIKPFGRNSPEGTNYTFPLAAGLIQDGQVTLHFQLHPPGEAEPRPATTSEVLSVTGYLNQTIRP